MQTEEISINEKSLDDFSYNDTENSFDWFSPCLGSNSIGYIEWNHPLPKSYWQQHKTKSVKVGVYETSSIPMRKIRKALTGQYTSLRVGTHDEDHFFVVNLASGIHGRKTPARLYFDSPYDVEKYCFLNVPESVKTKWLEKNKKSVLNKS